MVDSNNRGTSKTRVVATRMKFLLRLDSSRYAWSAAKWAADLGCQPSRVTATEVWRVQIREWRLKEQAAKPRSFDRRKALSLKRKA
jgi:hypothetical protein